MKAAAIIFVFFVFLAAGCQQPSDVTLTPPDDNPEIVVSSVVEVDSVLQTTPDSTGLVGKDRERYAGSLLVTDVKYDTGIGIVKATSATAVLEDRTRPIFVGPGKVGGYWGLFLGTNLRLNDVPLIPLTRRVGGMPAGWKYVGDLSLSYHPNQEFRWAAPRDTVGEIGDSISSPDDLDVLFPRGGAQLSRNSNLELRWKGEGTIAIIIQSNELATANVAKPKPLLLITPKVNRGRVVLDSKILALLPRGKNFIFTFILANRRNVNFANYRGDVLLQAASIYNSYVVIN